MTRKTELLGKLSDEFGTGVVANCRDPTVDLVDSRDGHQPLDTTTLLQ
ncbi:MAG: hypothetical protein VX614_04870 [Myxococcota bacterium]|nr:hypothetical protein [Myxococcota bacterium]